MYNHILSSASNVGWARLLSPLQQIGRLRHRDVKQFSQVETTQKGEDPQVFSSWGSTLSPRSLLPETLKEETRARRFLHQVTLSACYVLVGRDRVGSVLVCLRSWKRSFSLGNVQRKKICVSQVLGCYKQDEGRLICLRRDTLLSQDGALLPHLLGVKRTVISHGRRVWWQCCTEPPLWRSHSHSGRKEWPDPLSFLNTTRLQSFLFEDRYSSHSNERSRHSDCSYHQLVKANLHKRCAFTPPPEGPARLIHSKAQDQEFLSTTQGCWHQWSDGTILKTNWSPLAFRMSVSELNGTKGTPYNSIHLTGK